MAKIFKAVLVHIPIQHRSAIDRLKRQTRTTITALIQEAIEDLAQKKGLVTEGKVIRGWPDWE